MRVRACARAALTCRLLTEVFVCTQASELRGPPALPPLPSELRPCLRHLSDLAVFHCLLPTGPAGPPARTLSQPPIPSPPHLVQHPGIARGPLGTLPPQVDIGLGRLGAPTWTECQQGAAMRAMKTPPTPSLSLQGSTQQAHVLPLLQALSVYLSVCVSVTVREGCVGADVGRGRAGEDRAEHPQAGGA